MQFLIKVFTFPSGAVYLTEFEKRHFCTQDIQNVAHHFPLKPGFSCVPCSKKKKKKQYLTESETISLI